MSKVPVSVVIPVRNEAENLGRCLASVSWAAEVWVVDSQSTDGTVPIAEATGARVVQFAFNGTWPKKKNWALQTLEFAHEWVLLLDADEVMPASACDEIHAIVTTPGGPNGYWINRRFHFLGGWLRHAYHPNWNMRLFRHRLGRFEMLTESPTESGDVEIHEHVIVEGETGRLRSEMDHYAFPSVASFIEKHNRYSNWEARVACEGAHGGRSKAAERRIGLRAVLRRLSLRMPCRPLLRFLYVYVWQLGFLDGRRGYYFARLHATYELLCVIKQYELQVRRLHEDPGLGN